MEGKHIAHSTVQLRSVDDIQPDSLPEVFKCQAMVLVPCTGAIFTYSQVFLVYFLFLLSSESQSQKSKKSSQIKVLLFAQFLSVHEWQGVC